jgi:hypothetical protein
MNTNVAFHAFVLVNQRNYRELYDFCDATIKENSDAGSPIDPRVYAFQAIAAAHFGLFDRVTDLLKLLWSNKRTIIKWGRRGYQFISIILTLILMPERIESVAEKLVILMTDA